MVLVDALELVLLSGGAIRFVLLGNDSVADLRGRVAGMFGALRGDVVFVGTVWWGGVGYGKTKSRA